MLKNIKKIICGALSILAVGSNCAISVSAYNVGDVIGQILSTDIVAYVEGVQIPSYNINGRTAIVAQDLNKLGGSLNFGVSFDEESRVLTITNKDISLTGSVSPIVYQKGAQAEPIGTPVGNVLYTDITTNFEGVPIESFNIGGLTCIYSDDLGKLCGTYLWDESSRVVNVGRKGTYIPSVEKHSPGRTLGAEESVITKAETFARWGESATSYLVQNSDGTYTAVEISEHINIEKYDAQFNHIESFAIAKEMPLVGTLYFGKQYNYIAFGQENLLEDNSREVIRIAIYDKNFVKISEVPIANCKTAVPFDASGADMYENDRYLVLHTSRSQYKDENGERPQTQLTVIVDKNTWQVCNVLGKFQYNHTSHALREFVRIEEDKIVTANYSDAAPIRGAFLQELDFEGKVLRTQSIFNVGGALAANCTGAMIGGLEAGEKGFFVPMSTIDHSIPTAYSSINIEGIERENRDIYLLWTDKETYEQRHICLARYTGVGLTGSVPYVVKLADGNMMVLWQRFFDSSEESSTVCYAFIDKEGNQIGTTYSINAQLSESCRPIDVGGRVVWYVNTEDGRDFYSVNAFVPEKTAEEEVLQIVEENKEELESEPEEIKNDEDTDLETKEDVESSDIEKDENALANEEDEKEKITEVDGI